MLPSSTAGDLMEVLTLFLLFVRRQSSTFGEKNVSKTFVQKEELRKYLGRLPVLNKDTCLETCRPRQHE
ncbi:hypothetical protein E2C01_096316 [Portunus trituberculatus]|uniref:Uncharacterized protein n=1 Tax=Portunus trituberculatus TaxID=210409 RepID=A0A5B7K2P7_PORTR|nr:hypothetical protein [Portunus trituberculatus]